MMIWRNGRVVDVVREWHGAQELTVTVSEGTARAINYPPLTGHAEVGDRVLLTASAVAKNLGTGGYLFVAALPDRLPPDPAPAPGHVVKARYTPLQYLTLGTDEQESTAHDLLAGADSIDGMPVVVADLHSALPAVVAVLRSRLPEVRIAYIMDDGGALPAWFSRTAAALTERGDILGTITAGQAFGGELETVNVHSALLAARLVWHADVAIVSQGPGNLGTDTRWGFSGVRTGEYVNAANALGGRAVALLRMSSADARERHRGISHHTLTALTRVALTPALCPVPVLGQDALSAGIPADIRARMAGHVQRLAATPHLTVREVPASALVGPLQHSPVKLSTMGRGLSADPLAFLAAGAAGFAAAELLG
ncbi:DUF3866 family protein [Neoactinobaculum massilliense]|uniref:DUF3866 family protein n=1 Tax=Neoactinobaculum massilliense TaxID=2364794 RepID=UPI000F5411F9